MTTGRRIVVDNATLSGVERITGVSQTRNLSNTDNDIICLEKIITAILFSDELIGVDDYTDKYRASRLKQFYFVSFIKMEDSVYSTLAKGAAEFANGMLFSFEGSKPAGDVVSFFEALRLYPQMRWDVFVSSEYLTLSLLVNNKDHTQYENSIDAAFRNEDTDQRMIVGGEEIRPSFSVSGHPEIGDIKAFQNALASGNPKYTGHGHRDILNRLVFGYGWVAERTHFYNAFAAMNGADAYLSPLRDAFCESCCRIKSRSQVNSLLEQLKNKSQLTLASIVEPSGHAQFAMRLPFFTAYYISKMDNPKQCIEQALSDRQRSEFQECRVVFQNFAHLSQQDKYKEVNKILRYLQQSCDALMKKYAVSTGNGLQFSLSLGLAGPSISGSFKLGQLFRDYRYNSFSRIFRNMAVDLTNVERLGELYDKLRSSVLEHKEATYSQIPTTPKFMENRESSYGRPAKL
jgi:hypothetical protein